MQKSIIYSFLLSILFVHTSYALDGDIYDFFLPNGMKVILMEKHSMPRVGLGVYYNVGSHDEKWGQKGINKFLFQVLNDGTVRYPSDEIKKKFDTFSMYRNSWTNKDMCFIVSELPKEELEFGLALESDIMKNPIIDQQSIAKNLTRYKIKYENYHQDKSWWRNNNSFKEILPPNHPYKTDDFGIWEQIDTLSLTTYKKYYDTYFTPNNAVLVVVGNINPKEVTELIYKKFVPIKSSNNIPIDPNFEINKKIDEKIPTFASYDEYTGSYGENVYMTFFMPSSRNDDTILLEHLSQILLSDIISGGNLNKKITKNRKIVDMIYSWTNVSLGPSGFSIYGYNMAKKISPKKFKNAVLKTFKNIAENGIDEKLLNQYKKSELLKFFLYENNDFGSIANKLGSAEIINGDYRFYNKKFNVLENITNKEIKRVAKTYLVESNMYLYKEEVNKHEKKWYFQLGSFIIHNTIWRIWNPFSELN